MHPHHPLVATIHSLQTQVCCLGASLHSDLPLAVMSCLLSDCEHLPAPGASQLNCDLHTKQAHWLEAQLQMMI